MQQLIGLGAIAAFAYIYVVLVAWVALHITDAIWRDE